MNFVKHVCESVEGKQLNIYICDDFSAPVIYANMHDEAGEEIMLECEKLGCSPFHFVSITGLRWDEEMSPWECRQVVTKNDNFTGEADTYLQLLSDKIITKAEQIISSECSTDNVTCSDGNLRRRILAGYSMGGLFALYAPYVSDMFSQSISVSGSVWFPDFITYAKNSSFIRTPDSIYLSIGDKESKTKNKTLALTQSFMEELNTYYKNSRINSTFELNPGNHFVDVPLRMAKGIAWSLKACL